jgi:AAA15 family ATPase/GTPase
MKLLRVGIRNYRSIGEECVFLDLRQKVNLLIGANNCGKSNVLRALELLSQKARPFKALPETDRFQRKTNVNSLDDDLGKELQQLVAVIKHQR